MFFTEYNEEKILEMDRRDVTKRVTKEVMESERDQTAEDMLRDHMRLPVIVKYSRLSESAVRKLAEKLKVEVVE